MKRKSLLSILSLVGLMSITSCGAGLDLEKNAPDYTNKDSTFMTFGYAPPTSGKYYENGLEIDTGHDNRTKERYEEYKEAGLNVLMLQSEDSYDYDKEWEDSELKRKMDIIESAGLSKIIVCDSRLFDLCNAETPIISDEGKPILLNGKPIQGGLTQFKSIQELSEYVGKLMHNYYNHSAFYGVIIRDEPFIEHLDNWCSVYKSIKEFDSKIFVEANLNPYSETEDHFKRCVPSPLKEELLIKYKTKMREACEEAYRYYLNYYLDKSGADRILMDSYPFLRNGSGSYFKEAHLYGLQVIGSICRERNVGFQAVAQTFGGTRSGVRAWDQMNAASMQWQLNSYLGYGSQGFGYFTYWRKVWNNNQPGGEWFNDGESFITNNGERTQLYYTMQTINAEIQKLAPVLSNFDYKASNTFVHEPCIFPTQYAKLNEEDFVLFKKDDFKTNVGSVALVTELQDRNDGQLLYMVQNALNPNLKEIEENLMMDYEVNFGSEYNAVEVYYRGERVLKPLVNGVYKSSLDAGYAEYLMPYKA